MLGALGVELRNGLIPLLFLFSKCSLVFFSCGGVDLWIARLNRDIVDQKTPSATVLETKSTVWKSVCREGDRIAFDTPVDEMLEANADPQVFLATEADESTTGPGSLMMLDPDGNPILIDQHV